MRTNGKLAWGVLAVIALTMVSQAFGLLPNARAAELGVAPAPESEEVYHNSVLRVSASEALPATKRVKLGMNKSMLIELPREVRDVLVSNPKMVEAVVSSSNRVYLIGSQMGQANAFFFDKNGDQMLVLEISVERDTVALSRLLERLIPGSDIHIEMLNDTVVLTGSVISPSDSTRASRIAARFVTRPGDQGNKVDNEKVLNMLQVAAKEQVYLKVTVAEMNRNMLKQLGINIGADINVGTLAINALTANTFPLTGSLLLPNTRSFGFDSDQNGGAFGQIFDGNFLHDSGVTSFQSIGKTRLGQSLRFMERNGVIRTLAEPNLTAISGETADVLVGGEFPIPVSQTDGKISVEYKTFGIGLNFTPLVLSEKRISMKISSEVSELSNDGAVQVNGLSLPALEVRRTNTTVELPSGGALVISGLISNKTKQNIEGMPGLKSLPVLGSLFRSSDFIKRETELIVIVAPYLVNPVARKKLLRPDDGYAPASDRNVKLFGQLNKVYGTPAAPPDGSYKGDYGFIVE